MEQGINMKKKVVVFLFLCFLVFSTFVVLQKILKRPMFSIIISVYNYADYLPETIESVLLSTYSDYEIIIVNDGSTDNSLDVMEYYAKRDTRIRLINQENQGLSIARNNAMKIAKGEYYWFVDADDFIDVDSLEKIANALQISTHENNGQKPDILSFKVQMVDADGIPYSEDWYTGLPDDILNYTIQQYDGSKLPLHTVMRIPVTSGKQIYRSDYLRQKNIIFPPRQVFEDDCFFLTVQLSGAKGIVIPEELYFKRNHSRSIVNNRPKHYDSVIRLPMAIYNSLKQQGISEEIATRIFHGYTGSIYYKWQPDAKYIPILESILNFAEQQPMSDFWLEQSKSFRNFIREKKIELGME